MTNISFKKNHKEILELKKIQEIYQKTIKNNLKDIILILKKCNIKHSTINSSYRKILTSSCENLTDKWLSQRKYLRTLFVKEAFSEFYPKKYIEFSLSIDVIVNILDDLLDEKINDREKTLYIIEFLRIFSLYNRNQPKKSIQIAVMHYFNKLITLAIAENYYKNLIKKETKMEKIIKYSTESYNIRSLDIDIFNEIAFIDCKISYKKNEIIKKIGKIFRAVNIIKKDIKDIEYDIKNNIETTITVMIKKKECNFRKFIFVLLNYYTNKANKANKIKLTKSAEKNFTEPINNFYNMIKKDKEEIIKDIKFL